MAGYLISVKNADTEHLVTVDNADQAHSGGAFAVNAAATQVQVVYEGTVLNMGGSAGSGDMSTLIYDPTGVYSNAFNLANQTGVLDAGTFF